jgi:uncharacterized membrane protein YhhN
MFFFFGAAVLVALLNWYAVSVHHARITYATKPTVIVLMMLGLAPWAVRYPALGWFWLGLGFSLVGDILLMLPRSRFLAGLVAFLLAHLAYIIGFNLAPPTPSLLGLGMALIVMLIVWQMYRQLVSGIPANLQIPVAAYMGVIGGMTLSAWLMFTRPDWSTGAAALVSVGAALFFISDSLIAWDKFVAPVRYRDVAVMSTYHLAQFGLILGAVLHYARFEV